MHTIKDDVIQRSLVNIRRQIYIVLGFSFFLNLLMLTVPLYMLQVYDRVLTAGSVPTLIALTMVAVVLVFAASCLEWVRSRLLVRLAGTLEQSMETPLLTKLLQSRGLASDRQRLSDMDKLSGFMSGAGIIALCDAPWIPIYLLVITMLHPVLGLIATFGALLLAVIAITSNRMTKKPMEKASSLRYGANRFAEQCLDNVEVTRALGMANGLVKHWQEKREQAGDSHYHASDRGGDFNAIGRFLRPLLQISMLGFGAVLVLSGQMTAGAMVAGSILLGRALAPLEMLINQWKNLLLTRQSWQKLSAYFQSDDTAGNTMQLPRPKGQLTIEKLVATVPGGSKPVIKGIGFELAAGESLAIVGQSASGKSTLARLLMGIWSPGSGVVRLDGADVSQWPRDELGQWLGYLPQSVELFPGTIKDNIARFSDVDAQTVIQAAQMAGVHDLVLGLPDGYETFIGQGAFHLSGGQQQRIALARAIYGNPSLVVLDEPDANLDRQGEVALVNALKFLRQQGVTTVVITHRPTLLKAVDKIMVMANGCIDQFGDTENILIRQDRHQELSA